MDFYSFFEGGEFHVKWDYSVNGDFSWDPHLHNDAEYQPHILPSTQPISGTSDGIPLKLTICINGLGTVAAHFNLIRWEWASIQGDDERCVHPRPDATPRKARNRRENVNRQDGCEARPQHHSAGVCAAVCVLLQQQVRQNGAESQTITCCLLLLCSVEGEVNRAILAFTVD